MPCLLFDENYSVYVKSINEKYKLFSFSFCWILQLSTTVVVQQDWRFLSVYFMLQLCITGEQFEYSSGCSFTQILICRIIMIILRDPNLVDAALTFSYTFGSLCQPISLNFSPRISLGTLTCKAWTLWIRDKQLERIDKRFSEALCVLRITQPSMSSVDLHWVKCPQITINDATVFSEYFQHYVDGTFVDHHSGAC